MYKYELDQAFERLNWCDDVQVWVDLGDGEGVNLEIDYDKTQDARGYIVTKFASDLKRVEDQT